MAINIHPQRSINMRQLSTEEFLEYIEKKGQHYLVNPRENLAFRSYTKDGKSYYFCKEEGGHEKEIRHDDLYYNEALLFSMVITKEEYDNY